MSNKPIQFHASIGGYMGPSYKVDLVGDGLVYQASEGHYRDWKTEQVHVTDEQWGDFRVAMDSIDAWNWEAEYSNPAVCDGTSWSLKVAYDDKAISTSGRNEFPGRSAHETEESFYKSVFYRFLMAVSSLVGGRKFR